MPAAVVVLAEPVFLCGIRHWFFRRVYLIHQRSVLRLPYPDDTGEIQYVPHVLPDLDALSISFAHIVPGCLYRAATAFIVSPPFWKLSAVLVICLFSFSRHPSHPICLSFAVVIDLILFIAFFLAIIRRSAFSDRGKE